jgi:hypothetical protein
MHVTSQTTVAAPIETVWDKLSNHASFPLVKAPLAVLCQILLRSLARASTKRY